MKKNNPSNILSKECIVSALIKLINQKNVSEISISELCNVAGVSRMTFYRNYVSIEDVFKQTLDEILEKYAEDSVSKKRTSYFFSHQNLLHYFDYLQTYSDFMDGLIKCGFGIYFLDRIDAYIITKWKGSADILTLHAFAGSIFNIFQLWSKTNHNIDVVLAATIIENLYHFGAIASPINA